MSGNAITRRGFLAGSAGAAALAGCGGVAGLSGWQHAYAKPPEPVAQEQVHTLCDGCGNQCGMTAWVRDGELWRLTGEPGHPNARGALCGRGQGFSAIVHAPGRVEQPLKKNEQGVFEPVSWDQALAEIGEQLGSASPEQVAVFQARGHADFFVKRFAQTLGTPNYYTDAAVHDADIVAAIEAVSGAYPSPDPAASKYMLMLDKSTYDGFRPSEIDEFVEARQRGGKIVLVDPRLTAFGNLADAWVPIRPGTELALLLAIAGELVRTGRYDKEFVAKNAHGFEEFAAGMEGYTLEWAAQKTGIERGTIAEIVAGLADAAPACFVDLPWAGTFGAGYKNSADTVRMVYLLNALLGNFNQPGGWVFGNAPYLSDDLLDEGTFKSVPSLESCAAGGENAPLAWGDSCVAGMRAMADGSFTAAVLCETNPVRDYPAAAKVTEALESLECLVVCDTMMTETAELARYVLPLDSYLERRDTVGVVAAKTSVAALRNPVLPRVFEETRSIDQVFSGLAEQCGLGEYFAFDLEDYNRACAEALGVGYDGLARQAVADIPGARVSYGEQPRYRTESGKIEFASPAFEAAGLSAVPVWTDPEVVTAENLPRLLVGEQAVQAGTYTTGADLLTEISKEYGLDGAWINTRLAASLDIADGDTVELSTTEGSLRVRAKVTDRIHPEAVWMPAHYGISASAVSEAEGFGAAPKQLIPWALEPGTGAAMMHEVAVSVRKVGA